MKVGQHGKLGAFNFFEKYNRPPFGFLFELHRDGGDFKSRIDFAGDDQKVFRLILFDGVEISAKVLRHSGRPFKKGLFQFTKSKVEVFSSPLHLITLSARASTFGGIVRPICFAAFRLMINSNFVGCSTGKIGGLRAFKNLVHIRGGAPVQVGNARRRRS